MVRQDTNRALAHASYAVRGRLLVSDSKRNFKAEFERTMAPVMTVTSRTLRREIFTSCLSLNVGVA